MSSTGHSHDGVILLPKITAVLDTPSLLKHKRLRYRWGLHTPPVQTLFPELLIVSHIVLL